MAGHLIQGGHLGNIIVCHTVRAVLEDALLLTCAVVFGLWLETSNNFRTSDPLIKEIVANQEIISEIR